MTRLTRLIAFLRFTFRLAQDQHLDLVNAALDARHYRSRHLRYPD